VGILLYCGIKIEIGREKRIGKPIRVAGEAPLKFLSRPPRGLLGVLGGEGFIGGLIDNAARRKT
jgi:hypothetical protein